MFYLKSLIRTAEQLKIKGLCEINDHTNATESDTEVIYPPHKKIRASRNYENNNSFSNSNKNLPAREEFLPSAAKSSASLSDKDAHQSIAPQEESNNKQKSKSLTKESKSSSSGNSTQQSNKNMASLEMGMVRLSIDLSNESTFDYLTLEFSERKCRDGCSPNVHGFCT